MITYNICFVRRGNELLLLNREKPSWMGCWNGVGGKLLPGEQPRQSMIRELSEETGLSEHDVMKLTFKGLITWSSDRSGLGGMYVYVAELPAHHPYAVPVKTAEGVLDWKEISWVLHPDNQGVAANLPRTLPQLLQEGCYWFHMDYQAGQLLSNSCHAIEERMEYEQEAREALLLEVSAG